MPMQQITCHVPGCGAPMGGKSHEAAAGVTRLNTGSIYDNEVGGDPLNVVSEFDTSTSWDAEVGPVKGYRSDLAESNYESDAITAGSRQAQVGVLSISIIRCMCHMLMRLSMVVGGANQAAAINILTSTRSPISSSDSTVKDHKSNEIYESVMNREDQGWNLLIKRLGLSPSDVSFLFHMTIRGMDTQRLRNISHHDTAPVDRLPLLTKIERDRFEANMESSILEVTFLNAQRCAH